MLSIVIICDYMTKQNNYDMDKYIICENIILKII